MDDLQRNHQESDLPAGLSQPAQRALAAAGYTSLQQLTTLKANDIKRLHGVGPKTIVQLRQALRARGLSFAAEQADEAS